MIKEIYGKKIGMTQVFNSEGNVAGVTLVEIKSAYILEEIKYPLKTRVRIGCFKIEENKIDKVKKPILGYFNKLGIKPYRFVREVEVVEGVDLSFLKEQSPRESQETLTNREVGIEIFNEGALVDVRAKTKGRGFAGGMKRHGWTGQPKSHGSTSHRRIGSAGANTDPGRIVKGHRMPGHMGNVWRTIKNLKILKVDKEKNLLFIGGVVPGSRGSIVRVKKVSR